MTILLVINVVCVSLLRSVSNCETFFLKVSMSFEGYTLCVKHPSLRGASLVSDGIMQSPVRFVLLPSSCLKARIPQPRILYPHALKPDSSPAVRWRQAALQMQGFILILYFSIAKVRFVFTFRLEIGFGLFEYTYIFIKSNKTKYKNISESCYCCR